MLDNGNGKGFGDAHGSNVVVGGADTTGGKDVIIGLTHLIDGADDDVFVVRYDSGVLNLNAPATQGGGDVVQVNVLGASGQYFIADDDDAGGDGLAHWRLFAIQRRHDIRCLGGRVLTVLKGGFAFGGKGFAALFVIFAVEAGIHHFPHGFHFCLTTAAFPRV